MRSSLGLLFTNLLLSLAGACAPIDANGEPEDLIVVDYTSSALSRSPAMTDYDDFDGVLDPSVLVPAPGLEPSGELESYRQDSVERDCTFEERANLLNDHPCPDGKLLGTCTVQYDVWADDSEHVTAVIGLCSIDSKPTS